MSRQLALRGLKLVTGDDNSKSKEDLKASKKSKQSFKSKNKKTKQHKNKASADDVYEQNLKYLLQENDCKSSVNTKKILEYLNNPRASELGSKYRKKTSDFNEEDLDFSGSILFKGKDNVKKDDEDGDGFLFGEDKQKKRKEVFKRKK